jgi:hypothetical protein
MMIRIFMTMSIMTRTGVGVGDEDADKHDRDDEEEEEEEDDDGGGDDDEEDDDDDDDGQAPTTIGGIDSSDYTGSIAYTTTQKTLGRYYGYYLMEIKRSVRWW